MVRKVGMGGGRPQTQSNSWEDYLDADEKLLWQGAPATGLRFSGKGLFISIFGLFFLGFSVFWVTMAASFGTNTPIDYVFPLFGLPFVAVGLWLVVGHWFYDAYKRKRSRYALTDQRAIIARRLFGRKMESYDISKDAPIYLVEGDLDTVNFAQRTYRTKNGTNTVSIGFRFIEDGRKVFNLLKEVREQQE